LTAQSGDPTAPVRHAQHPGELLSLLDPGWSEQHETPEPHAFARIGELDLLTPTARPLLVGFHEAGGPSPLPLEPLGERRAPEEAIGRLDVSHAILGSRGRGTSPTSAVDIVVRPGEEVLSPVTGTVASVSRYVLYGSATDVIVVLRPDDAPDLLVKVLHVEGVVVSPGDKVAAGETVVAGSGRILPFSSQVDRIVGERLPHVHIEVVRAG
jgi:biotin carboxyl carrier protein